MTAPEDLDPKTVYDTFSHAAAMATQLADNRPTASNHRRAAEKHLAAAAHANAVGKHEDAARHDGCAEEHMRQMRMLQDEEDGQ